MENICRFVLNLKAKVKKKPLVVGESVLLKCKVAKNSENVDRFRKFKASINLFYDSKY